MTIPLYTLEPLTEEQRYWLHARLVKKGKAGKRKWRKAEVPYGDPRRR